ncbi:MAG: hypothetical protein K9H65_00005 [Bacteroidales bacterium]|nr:hypothetical protein [Bacteroidales bacterium]
MKKKTLNIITLLTVLLSVALAIVSYFGAFVEGTYARDSESMGAQGMGQDMVNLFVAVPLIIVSLILIYRNIKAGWFLLTGSVFYVLYSFFIYAFGVYFNQLFLLYCLILGLSLYTFIYMLYEMNGMDIHGWFAEKVPVRLTGYYFILIAILFYGLWLKDVIPAIVNDTVPESVSKYNLLVNPVHVLDIGIVLPGLIIAAFLLMKNYRLGLILAPTLLVFIILLAIALIGMTLMLQVKGISDDTSVAGIFSFMAIISIGFLLMFLRKLKGKDDQ